MTDRIPLRFGVVAGRAASGSAWTATARRVEAQQLTALAAATGVTTFPVAQEHADAFAPVLAHLR